MIFIIQKDITLGGITKQQEIIGYFRINVTEDTIYTTVVKGEWVPNGENRWTLDLSDERHFQEPLNINQMPGLVEALNIEMDKALNNVYSEDGQYNRADYFLKNVDN